jgi:hypothetical protein
VLKHLYEKEEESAHGKHFIQLMKNVFCHHRCDHNLLDSIVRKDHFNEIREGDYVGLDGNKEYHEKVGKVVRRVGENIRIQTLDGKLVDTSLFSVVVWIRP